MDALKKQFALEVDHLLLLGCLQGSHQSLEDVGTAIIIKQDPELHSGLTISIYEKENSAKYGSNLHKDEQYIFNLLMEKDSCFLTFCINRHVKNAKVNKPQNKITSSNCLLL